MTRKIKNLSVLSSWACFFPQRDNVQRTWGMSLGIQVIKYGGESEFLIMTVDNIMVENDVAIMKQHTNECHNGMLSFKLSQRNYVWQV